MGGYKFYVVSGSKLLRLLLYSVICIFFAFYCAQHKSMALQQLPGHLYRCSVACVTKPAASHALVAMATGYWESCTVMSIFRSKGRKGSLVLVQWLQIKSILMSVIDPHPVTQVPPLEQFICVV